MRFLNTVVALAALTSATVAVAIAGEEHPPCTGHDKCSPEGALSCDNVSEWGQMLFWCENSCWTLKQHCKSRCETTPEPHCV